MAEDNEHPGGGSGGADCEEETKGNQTISADGTYSIRANQIALTSWKNLPPSADNESRIMLHAMGSLDGLFSDDGTVDVRGCKGVRITSGSLFPVLNPHLCQRNRPMGSRSRPVYRSPSPSSAERYRSLVSPFR